MIRTLDPLHFNTIANHPEVRPWLGGIDPLDLTAVVSNPDNFCYLTDTGKGGYIYHKKLAGIYEVHTLSLPDGRGRDMLKARDQSLANVFTQSDALEVVTMVPDGNEHASRWASHAGFLEDFRRDEAIFIVDGLVGASYRSLSYARWVLLDKDNAVQGQAFHTGLHELIPADHGEDPVHDAWVGATIRGIENGNTKAIGLYNRWCAHSGYEPIRVLSLNPLVMDIRTAIIEYTAAGLTLLRQARSAHEKPNGKASCPQESQQQSA